MEVKAKEVERTSQGMLWPQATARLKQSSTCSWC